MDARLKFWRRSCVPEKGSTDEAVEIPPAPPPNLTRLLRGSQWGGGVYGYRLNANFADCTDRQR